MNRLGRMAWFQIRQFVAVPYFIELMVITTVTTTIIQVLGAHAWGVLTPTQGWVRGGVIGMWTTTTCAAGIIGFERYKGTLAYLVLAPIGALRTLACVVCSAAFFGLLALPLAWATWALTSGTLGGLELSVAGVGRLLLGIAALELGCVALSLVVASIFVLTPNAITYEGLLLVPVMIASGLLVTTNAMPSWMALSARLLPLRLPYEVLIGARLDAGQWLAWIACVAAWLGLA